MLKQKYRKSPEAVVNYNYTDIASGIGIITFYGASSGFSGSEILTTTQINDPSYYCSVRGTTTSNLYTDVITKTFTSEPFKLSRRIKGSVLASIPFTTGSSGGSANMCKVKFNLKVYKNNTLLSDDTSGEYPETSSDTGNPNGYVIVTSTAIPETIFAPGDQLKMYLSGSLNDGGGTGTVALVLPYKSDNTALIAIHSANFPSTLTATAGSTQLLFKVPFRVTL
jgi:hypothetical protein